MRLYQLYICLLFLFSCYKRPSEKLITVTILKEDFQDPAKQNGSVITDKTNSTNKLSRISKKVTYGNGFIFPVPDSLANKTLRLIFRAKVRNSGKTGYGHEFVTSLNKGDEQFDWSIIKIDPFIKKQNEWNMLIDSTQIPAFKNTVLGGEIRIFAFNRTKFDYLEYDDLSVEIKVVH